MTSSATPALNRRERRLVNDATPSSSKPATVVRKKRKPKPVATTKYLVQNTSGFANSDEELLLLDTKAEAKEAVTDFFDENDTSDVDENDIKVYAVLSKPLKVTVERGVRVNII